MRLIPIFAALTLLSACDLDMDSGKRGPVDVNALGPLSGREQALLLGAQGAVQSGNPDAAERDFMSAVAASTGHVEAHIGLAELYLKQNKIENARNILERAREFQPDQPRVNYLLGKLALAKNDSVSALAFFNRGLGAAPNDIDLLTAAAISNDMLGQHVAAQRLYQRAINGHPQDDLSGARTNLGMSYLLSGNAKKAVEVLKPEAKKTGASPVTRHNLALAYGMLGRHTEAKALVKGELDEETRNLAIARLKEYVESQRHGRSTEALKPPIAGLK